MIKALNLTKVYNKNKKNALEVLKGVNLDLPNTGLISLLGRSGSGKSTLLHILGGLDNYSGTIEYDGKTYKGYNLDLYRQENIGIIFQNYLLFPDLTVIENLKICLNIIGIVDEEEVEARIEYVLKKVGMYKKRKKLAKNLSGGEQQRISIARALIKNAKIILADEPTGNLDKANSLAIMNILKEVSKTTLVLLVTHNNELAKNYSDNIIYISDGNISNNVDLSDVNNINSNEDDVIYLEDYQKDSTSLNNLELNIYANEDYDLKINLIYRDNRYYLVANKNISILSPDRLKEKRTEIVEKEIDFDNSCYNNNLKRRRSLSKFKDSFVNFFKNRRKKDKLLKISFFGVGFILAISVTSFFNYLLTPYEPTAYKNKYVIVDKTYDSYVSYDILEDILPYVCDLSANSTLTVSLVEKTNSIEDYQQKVNTYINNKEQIEENELVAGNLENVVITTKLADMLSDNYEDILNKNLVTMGIKKYYFKVSGIIEDEIAVLYTTSKEMYVSSNSVDLKYATIYNISDYNYEVIDGFVGEACVLENSKYDLNDVVTTKSGAFTVDGIIRLKEDYVVQDDAVFLNSNDLPGRTDIMANEDLNYKIIKGEDITNNLTCLLPAYMLSFYNVGDKINSPIDNYTNLTIVGFYDASYSETFGNMLVNSDTYNYLYNRGNFSSDLAFEILDYNGLINYLNEQYNQEVSLISQYDYYVELYKAYNYEDIIIYGIISLVLIITYVLLIYFVMRSKVLKEQYEIAVYRTLGATKRSFYFKYLKEVIVLSTFTTLIGYLIMFTFFALGNSLVNEMSGMNLFLVNFTSFGVGIGMLYLINIVIGLLPIYMYLKRSPANLITKYDM